MSKGKATSGEEKRRRDADRERNKANVPVVVYIDARKRRKFKSEAAYEAYKAEQVK